MKADLKDGQVAERTCACGLCASRGIKSPQESEVVLQ